MKPAAKTIYAFHFFVFLLSLTLVQVSCWAQNPLDTTYGTAVTEEEEDDEDCVGPDLTVHRPGFFGEFLKDVVDAHSIVGLGLFNGIAGLGNGAANLVKPTVIKLAINKFLGGVEIPKEVRERMQDQMDSPEFTQKLIPFLMALKDLYTAQPEKTPNFEDYIKQHFKKEELPGLEHTLLNWKEKEKGGFNIEPALIAKIVLIYDAIFLQGQGRKLGDPPKRDPEVVKRTMPVLRELLKTALTRVEGGAALGEVLEGVKLMTERDDLLETATISLIDFMDLMIYKHYKMFQDKEDNYQIRKKELLAELDKEKDGTLFKEMKEKLENNKFAVHVLVDGLQGHLMEALSKGKTPNTFLTKIYEDDKNQEKYLPPTEKVTKAPAQSTQFLKFMATNGFDHPKYLPFFKKLYAQGQGKNGIVTSGVATTPTISVRNLPIAQTGAPVSGPGGIDLPNFHFIDREQDRAYYFYGNDALMLSQLTKVNGMKTIFERLGNRGINCFGSYDAGASFQIDAFLNLGLGEKDRDFGERLCLAELQRRAKNEIKLRELRKELLSMEDIINRPSWFGLGDLIQRGRAKDIIDEIARLEQDTLPPYLHYYIPWPDHFAHFTGPFSDEIIAPTGELNRLDYWLKQVQKVYKQAGLAGKTLFGMSGDHGLTPVYYYLNPETVVMDKLKQEMNLDLKVLKISSDEGEGPKLTNPLRPPSSKGYDMIVASTGGGNYMFDFFVDQAEGWKRQPLYSELTDLQTLSGPKVDIVEAIRDSLKETLEYMAIRETPFTLDGGTTRLIASDSQGKKVEAFVSRKGNKVFYESAEDLLGVNQLSSFRSHDQEDLTPFKALLQKCLSEAKKENPSTWCEENEWRFLTSFTNKPDSVVQISHLYDNPRAGTVNLFPKEGIGFNTKVPGRHAGEVFHEKDAFIGLWGGPVEVENPIKTAVIGSIPVTLYEYLSGEKTEINKDGIGYESLLPRIVKN